MGKLDFRKLVGAFIYVIAICFLFLAVIGVLNKVDYINEYEECIDVAKQNYASNPQLIEECKANASQGLGFELRQNQTSLSTVQHIQIYLVGIINVLLAVLLLIVGKVIYNIKPRRPKPIKKSIDVSKHKRKKSKSSKKKSKKSKKKKSKKKKKKKSKKRK